VHVSKAHKEAARSALEAHGSSIDELHQKLASAPGVDKERLHKAVREYKAAHQTFTEDALGCMN
jgi:hypothetical protein